MNVNRPSSLVALNNPPSSPKVKCLGYEFIYLLIAYWVCISFQHSFSVFFRKFFIEVIMNKYVYHHLLQVSMATTGIAIIAIFI